jgi:hypothetical protein
LLCLCILIVYLCIFIVPAGTLRLPRLRFFRAFFSVVRQMPGYNRQRRGTARTLPKFLCCSIYCFLCVLCIVCVWMCTVLLPPSTAVNKYIMSCISYHIVSCRVVSYRIVSYIISHHFIYHIIYHIIISSHHIISYRIIAYISYHIIYVIYITCHIYHIISYRIIYHIISYIISYHILYHIISYHI